MHCNNDDQIQNSISFGERAGKIRPGRERGIPGTLFIFFNPLKHLLFKTIFLEQF